MLKQAVVVCYVQFHMRFLIKEKLNVTGVLSIAVITLCIIIANNKAHPPYRDVARVIGRVKIC